MSAKMKPKRIEVSLERAAFRLRAFKSLCLEFTIQDCLEISTLDGTMLENNDLACYWSLEFVVAPAICPGKTEV